MDETVTIPKELFGAICFAFNLTPNTNLFLEKYGDTYMIASALDEIAQGIGDSKQITAETYRARAEKLIEKLTDLTENNIPSHGDKEEDCQRICILNAISGVEHSVNGLRESDMIK